MYENTYMYAVERNGEYLAHYGIRGMKWGVRKAREKGSDRALGRQYAKAQKKLAKLEKRAVSGKKYAKRAAALGAGAAAAGGLAVAGTSGIASGMRRLVRPAAAASRDIGYALTKVPGRNKVSQALHRTGATMYTAGKGGKVGGAMTKAATAVDQWGKSKSIGEAAGKGVKNAWDGYARSQLMKGTSDAYLNVGRQAGKAKNLTNKVSGVSNNTIARIGAGAVGAGLAAGAGYNAYRAATTKRAAKKAAQFRSEMNKAFKGTKYANGGSAPRQGKKRRRR